MPQRTQLSIILPVHNERANLPILLDEIDRAMVAAALSYEVIAVDDGSNDGSAQYLREEPARRPQLRTILLRRNYGQSAAFDAGFRAARGDVAVTMDADLQNDPADIPMLLAKIEEGYDLVAGRRFKRQDGFVLRKLPSLIANFVIRRVTKTTIKDLGCSLKAYRRSLYQQLRLYGEMHRFIPILAEGHGAQITEVDVNHRPRTHGVTKYNLSRTFKVLLDLQTVWFMRGFESKPIHLFGGLAMFFFVLSVGICAWVLFEKFYAGVFVHRNPLFILGMISFMVSVQLLCLGLVAEILVRTYFESQDRTSYLVADRINFDGASEPMPSTPQPVDNRTQDTSPP
jgi:glycosyltransferase involved in cell wall biosynthesis